MTLAGPAQRLAQHLTNAGRIRVPLDDLFGHWASACPELIGSSEQFRDLAHALEQLATADIIVLPAAGSWDRSTRPPLPKFVTCSANRVSPAERPWRTYPWRAELGWASSLLKLTATQYKQLVEVNQWLAVSTDDRIVPMRVRSAEIFKDEKALDRLINGGLFTPGRLTVEMLRCRRFPNPLTITRTGAGPDVLVVENADAYWVALDAACAVDGPVGRVAWGAGAGFAQGIYALVEEPEVPEHIWYWGDLDPKGIAIPTLAAKLAPDICLPELQPAAGLWGAMAKLSGTDPGEVRWSGSTGTWLGASLWAATAAVRAAHARVAQERLGADTVAAALKQLHSLC